MGANVFQTTTVSREKAEKSMRIYHLGGRFIIKMLCELDVHMDFHRGTSHINCEKKFRMEHFWDIHGT